jgi:phosphopantetheine--protein transferase-like protein
MVSKYIGPGVIRNDPGITNRAIKPLIPDGFFFNISHDNDFVLLGTCNNQSVGIDIMKVKQSNPNIPIPDMLSNLKGIFTDVEWTYITSVRNPRDQLTRFFELWTAKEAYVKCLGTGLYTEPQELSLEGMEKEVLSGWKNLSISQVGFMHRSDEFRILVTTTVVPDHVIAVCVGAVELCDDSWTRFIQRDSVCDPNERVIIFPPIHVRLADLV